MSGWFQALSQLAGGLGQGLDRYTQMRQLDQDNMWKRKLQQAQLDQSAQQGKLGDLQAEQLGDAILRNKRADFTSMLTPGQDTSDATMALGQKLGLGDTFRPGQTENAPFLNGSQGAFLPGVGLSLSPGSPGHEDESVFTPVPDQPNVVMGPGYSLPSKPVNQNQYMGTPAQNMDLYTKTADQRAQARIMAAIQGLPQDQQAGAYLQIQSQGHYDPSKFDPKVTGGGEGGFMLSLTDPAKRAAYLQNVKDLSAANYHPPAGTGIQMSPTELAFWANFMNTTGNKPALGGGVAGATMTHQFGQYMGENGGAETNFGALKGEVGANQSALRDIQKKADAIGAFETGATSNMKVAQTAVKQLQDFGAEAFNTPLRDLNKKFNDPNGDLANAALAMNTYIREYVRVTNNLGAGVLSDSARQEGEDMLKNGFTAAQFARVFPTMQQDMENVHSGFNDQIAKIKARAAKVGSKPGETNPNDPAGLGF